MPYKNKVLQKRAQSEHYFKNKDRVRLRNRARRIERKEWFYETVMKGAKCAKCSERDPACLEFHHKDPKEKEGEISKMLNEFRSKESILCEIKKCVVLCANCHRKVHYYSFGSEA